MISAATIGEIIRNPDLAGNHPTPELAEIRDKFPYCSTLHLIYLKGLSLGNDLQFEEHLRYAAVHIVDRERMYYLIHSNPENQQQQEYGARLSDGQTTAVPELPKAAEPITETPAIELKIVTEAPVEPIADLKTATPKANLSASDGQAAEPVIALKTTPEKVEESITEQKTTPEKEEPAIAEIIKPVEETKAETLTDVSENQLEENKQTGIKNILDAAPDLMELAYTEDLNAEEVIYQEKISALTDSSPVSEKNTLPENSDSRLPEVEPDLSQLSFIEWLQYKKSKKLPVQKETNTVKPAKKQGDQEQTTEEQPKKAGLSGGQAKKSGLSRSDVDALLNKFITEEPSISRPTAAFFSPVKTARQSLEEVPDLVTETLAKIYVLQKNYAKAIQAYEQLSLVYPEKKTFFATRIQKIKEDQQKQ